MGSQFRVEIRLDDSEDTDITEEIIAEALRDMMDFNKASGHSILINVKREDVND